ncbi:uncharacterized protein LOC108908169 [Anoplophora glabripennis]|uniref:uncharacterized protein LOC108908169 n=1 Tax=Anoplophora glabripennis TaxID=217634 RepID=UPI000873DE50|nr:uncharacterized protein LOC108908169 [Anoplophora glabripennis]
MELRYVLTTLLKILISTPNVLLLYSINEAYSAALMGGHLDNKSNSTLNVTDTYYEYDLSDSEELQDRDIEDVTKDKTNSEEIPDPSALVLPGYNLPENIFNHGKPFYVEKDPLTGRIDFSHKSPTLESDLYEYVDDEPNDNIYDKSNIDRKDGNINGHKPNDVNQLTPNFHDFLNLPVKYNPDKYVYPLISNSYSSTKVQGSVNKFHNHKDYNVKTTKMSTDSPAYDSTNRYFNPTKIITTPVMTTTMATTVPVTKRYPSIYLTPKPINLMHSEMSHPSFNEEFDYEVPSSTAKQTEPGNIYITTEAVNNNYLASKPSFTTKRPLSLFEQLFGDYEETIPTAVKTATPKIDHDVYITDKNNSKEYINIETSSKTTPVATDSYNYYQNSHGGPNVLSGSSMGIDTNYDYEDYGTGKYDDNIAVENRPIKNVDDDLKIEPLNVVKIESDKTVKHSENNNNIKNELKETTTAKYVITGYDEYDYQEKEEAILTTASTTTVASTTSMKPMTSTIKTTFTTPTITVRVTSLPLGENHVTNANREPINHDPIIVATQNLREKLNSEKVLPKPFETPMNEPITLVTHQAGQPPSTSNIHIAPDQDTVSFVVGNHQNVDNGQYLESSVQESPYDSNPFRPLYGQQAMYSNGGSPNHVIETDPQVAQSLIPLGQNYPEVVGSAVTIQPLKNSEASLAIGVPVGGVKQIPGQVVDEKLELSNNPIDFPKDAGSKIVFPDEKQPEFPDLIPPPAQPHPLQAPFPSRDILPLNSKPMYHQLPSDLTPPKEKEVIPPLRRDQRPIRPPWDPRPGHFHTGKPEYNRPPRPISEMAYKRIDNLPNILPQFRPNMNKHISPGHYLSNKLARQPLLERPSNRPIAFFEKLHPPPPPFPVHKNIQNLRKGVPSVIPPRQSLDETKIAQDRIINEGPRKPSQQTDHFGFYQTPPQIKIANRRNSDDMAEVETLQMIQAKNTEKVEKIGTESSLEESQVVNIPAESSFNDNTEKTIYKVYPVNTPPIKLDVIDNTKTESVVIGTRAELPLPPSKINTDFTYDQNPLFDKKDRNDAPILKPHPRPSSFPVKSDFPYPLERPDPAVIHPPVPETPSNTGNGLDDSAGNKFVEEPTYLSNNQWNTIGENIESRIVNSQKQNLNQISVTLKTFTEKPIAVAYTPTEPNLNADKYSMPNYGSPVIPEIRPGTVENADTSHSNSEFTVSAVMHTHHQTNIAKENIPDELNKRMDEHHQNSNHKNNIDTPNHTKLDFEAPFQASINIDHSINQGWSVVRNKNKTTTEVTEFTTVSYATTGEFDIENFKPQLEGGFKPIYNFPDEKKLPGNVPSDREE